MTWLCISNDHGRKIRCRNACALASATLALVAFEKPVLGQYGSATGSYAISNSAPSQSAAIGYANSNSALSNVGTPANQPGTRLNPDAQTRTHPTSTYQLPAPQSQNFAMQQNPIVQFPSSGDISASPWSQSQTPTNHVSASNGFASNAFAGRMVNHSGGYSNRENIEAVAAPKESSQTPVATLSWGAIHPLPERSVHAHQNQNVNNAGPYAVNEINSATPDGQFYGLGAPMPVSRSVQSHQVSSSTERSIPIALVPEASPTVAPAEQLELGYEIDLDGPSGSSGHVNGNRYLESPHSEILNGNNAAPRPLTGDLPSQDALKPSNAPTNPQSGYVQPAPALQSVPTTPDPRWLAEQKQLQTRRELAEKVSQDILSNGPTYEPSSIRPLESPAGWSSVEQDLRVHMEKCEQLLRRNAVHSGREEIVLGMRRLTRMLDAMTGTPKCETAMDRALTSLREESEFQHAEGIVSIQDLVASHSTPILKNVNLKDVTAETASQHYRHYTRQQFVLAAEQHPWAADLLYAYGKTLEKEADSNFESAIRLRSQAVICYQAALQIQQGHPSASSQLGYSLLKLDRLDEAEQILSTAVHQTPNASNWSNLAEVLRRRGAMQQSQYALAQASHLAPQSNQYTPDNPEVTQVNPSEFARYSPAHNAAAPVATSVQQSAKPTEPVKTANIFSNLFR